MESQFFIFNGIIKHTNENNFNILNRGFQYGDGFFESLIAFNQKIPFLNLHLKRIKKAFSVFKFQPIDLFNNPNELLNIITYLARKNKIYKAYRIRISFYRKSGGLYLPKNYSANYIIQISPLNNDKFFINRKGLFINIYPFYSKNYSPFSQFKTLNAIPFVFAKIYAHENNYDNLILLNSNNNIVEATDSNIFLFRDNKLFTPDIKQGCVNGIMRHIIISIAKEANITVFEKNLTIKDLHLADEVFLSNATSGLKFVVAFLEKRYNNIMAPKFVDIINKKIFI